MRLGLMRSLAWLGVAVATCQALTHLPAAARGRLPSQVQHSLLCSAGTFGPHLPGAMAASPGERVSEAGGEGVVRGV